LASFSFFSPSLPPHRCQYLALSYALVPSLSPAASSSSSTAAAPTTSSQQQKQLTTSYGSALSLLSRAKLYVREARHAASALESRGAHDDADEEDLVVPVLALDEQSFAALEQALEGDERRLAREWFDAAGGRVSGAEGEEDEDEELDLAELSLADGEKAQQQQQQQAAPPKVPFYDVAFNYVTAFDMDAIAARAGLGGAGAGAAVRAGESSAPASTKAAAADEESDDEEEVEQQQEKPAKRGWGFGLFGRG